MPINGSPGAFKLAPLMPKFCPRFPKDESGVSDSLNRTALKPKRASFKRFGVNACVQLTTEFRSGSVLPWFVPVPNTFEMGKPVTTGALIYICDQRKKNRSLSDST